MSNAQGGDLAVSVGGVYYYTDPSTSHEEFDRKIQELEQATASRNNRVDTYDGDSEVKATVKKFLCDTDTALLPIIGAGATIGLPTSTTIIYADPNRTITCANALCDQFTIKGARGKAWEIEAQFLCTSVPARTAGYVSTRPTFGAVGNYLYWRDLLTFASAAGSTTSCMDFEITVKHNLDPFPGVRADGLSIPTVYTPTTIQVTGKFTMQMLSGADYDLYLAACNTPADITLTGKAFCGTTPPTMTLTIKSGIYSKVMPQRALKKVTMEQFEALSKALGGANPAVVNIA